MPKEVIADHLRAELIGRISSRTESDGVTNVAAGLGFGRYNQPTAPKHGIYLPTLCVVAQGAKEVQFAGERLRYDPFNYLIVSLDVPVVSQVVEATEAKPFLSLVIELDPNLIASVLLETEQKPGRQETSIESMATNQLDGDLLDAVVRLTRLVEDDPVDYRAVSPMVRREIVYRLLKGQQGQRLMQMANFGGNKHRIAKAIELIRTNLTETLRVPSLAAELGMSVSSFHDHFKTATSMSPLQFQKVLRLQEARRLLLTGSFDATTAASEVGYEDASHFSREYKRLFGAPPMRDVEQIKQQAITV